MKLLIISHTEHFLTPSGMVGFAPTLREIDHLAGLFDEVVHIATLKQDAAPRVAAPYRAKNVRLRLLPARGGDTLVAKLGNLAALPRYLMVVFSELGRADAVHVRCPAFVSLLALLCLCLRKNPRRRWLKYAGNWRPDGSDPVSYRLQRWLLRKGWAGGGVTVNGQWPDLPDHVHTFLNPCLTRDEIAAGRAAAECKHLAQPVRLLFVGRLEEAKGALCCLDIAAALEQRGYDVRLDLVGDGPSRAACERRIAAAERQARYHLHGWLDRETLNRLYAAAHFVVLPTFCSEGWPKVLSEGMAHGAIPIAAAVGSIPSELDRLLCGQAVSDTNSSEYADAIESYVRDPDRWARESLTAQAAAAEFGYHKHVERVAEVLELSAT